MSATTDQLGSVRLASEPAAASLPPSPVWRARSTTISAARQLRQVLTARRERYINYEVEAAVRRLGHPGVLADFLMAAGRGEKP